MKHILSFIAIFFLFINISYACSMYKITINGRTIVGNNEDWFNPNSQIWFEPKGNHLYGIMNIGFDDGFPQGGINEAGLMFDGFAMPYLEVKNTQGKKKIPMPELTNPIMHNFATVEEVRDYLLQIDLSFMSDAMVVFVDKSGSYLIVEGDELILGNDAEQSFSNFYPSQCSSRAEVPIPFYQNGLAHINATEAEANLDYCSTVMNSMKQDITLYSSIYDLQTGIVRIYHYQNFDNFIEIDIKEELKKGAHKLNLPEQFNKETEGYKFYEMYKDPHAMKAYYKTTIDDKLKMMTQGMDEDALKSFKAQMDAGIIQWMNLVASTWGESNNDYEGEIIILTLITDTYPENYLGYDSIGNLYYENKEYELAMKNYKKSLVLNPDNEDTNKKVQEIQEIQSNKKKP